MNISRARFFAFVLLVGIGFLSGCQSVSSPRQVAKNALQARVIGRLFEAGVRAADNNNAEEMTAVAQKLRDMGAVRQADLLVVEAAEKAVIDAIRFEFSTRSTGNAASSTRRAQMLAQAAQNYRLALQLDPNFSSNDPQLLNALGYFLAEKGASSTDFQKAELLTRRALAGWDKAAKAALLKPAEVDLNRAITRDSLAWALFRQQKFAEATREQRIAVADAQKALAAGANDPNGEALAELKTHLQQIEAALDTSKTKR